MSGRAFVPRLARVALWAVFWAFVFIASGDFGVMLLAAVFLP